MPAESTPLVFVLPDGLHTLAHTIDLDVSTAPDEAARLLYRDPNRGAEGLALMKDGHLLLVKQRDPIMLVEFGPEADVPPHAVRPGTFLAPGDAFR